MMRFFLIVYFLFLTLQDTFSISAYPGKVPVVIDGQKVYIKMFGDEHSKWAETEEGRTIIQNNDNKWWYAKLSPDGTLISSEYAFTTNLESNDDKLQAFIRDTPLHLKPVKKISPINVLNSSSGKVVGERRILVILMSFQDLNFSKSSFEFDQLFNQIGYNEDNAYGSVRDYYLSSSYGQLMLTSDIYGPYTASHNMGYYGNNSVSGHDINPYELFEEAINFVSEEVDLKLYDGDGDGYLDNVHIIYAGHGEEAGAPASAIWAHESSFSRPYEIQGIKIDRYSCAPELRGNTLKNISRIGPHCHEIGHALGAIDYYDTNYATDGQFSGTGKWDVMAQGSWNNEGITPADFNPYVKAFNFGWIVPKKLPQGIVSISPSNFNDDYYLLKSNQNGDYYLIENRSKNSWGAGLPGQGLLIYHIHQDITNARNNINVGAPQKCYIVCASSKSSKPSNLPESYGEINSSGCPYPGTSMNHSFNSSSTPVAFFWTGNICGIDLQDITLNSNGEVELLNCSEGIDYEPQEIDFLLEESFESEPHFRVISSVNEEWKIVQNPNNDTGFIDRPLAHSGIHSLQLSAKGYYWDNVESTIEFECNPKGSEGTIIISGYFISMGLSGKNANDLKIGYLSSEGEWIFSEIKSSSLSWSSFSLKFPCFPVMKIRIIGNTIAGSILAIDDITVTENTLISYVRNDNLDKNSSAIIARYSMNGIKTQRQLKGINILRCSNNCIKKVLIP